MTDEAALDRPARESSQKLNTARLRDLSQRRLFPWLTDAVMDWVVIGAGLALFGRWPCALTLLLAVLITGNRQHALTVLGHDGTHYTLSGNARFNDILTNLLCFLPLGLTVSGYRALHYAHHKHTGTENDPELGHKRMRSPQWDLPADRWKNLYYALADLAGGSLPDYLIIVRFSKPALKREYLYLGGFHLLALAGLVAAGLWWAAFVWYFSLVTSFMMYFRLRLWLEHQGTADTLRVDLSRWQGALLSPHNAFYHWEHHRYPTIPYHKLPETRALLGGESACRLGALIDGFETARAVPSGTPLKSLQEERGGEARTAPASVS
jgi:fatty acid desaturase